MEGKSCQLTCLRNQGVVSKPWQVSVGTVNQLNNNPTKRRSFHLSTSEEILFQIEPAFFFLQIGKPYSYTYL